MKIKMKRNDSVNPTSASSVAYRTDGPKGGRYTVPKAIGETLIARDSAELDDTTTAAEKSVASKGEE